MRGGLVVMTRRCRAICPQARETPYIKAARGFLAWRDWGGALIYIYVLILLHTCVLILVCVAGEAQRQREAFLQAWRDWAALKRAETEARSRLDRALIEP